MVMDKGLKIAVIGDGGWGTTLAILLANKGYSVRLWGPFADYTQLLDKRRENIKFLPGINIPDSIQISSDISKAAEDAAIIVLAVPSHFMRQVVERLKPLSRSAVFLSVAKGIENKTLMPMSEVIRDALGELSLAVLSGPSIAMEVAKGIPTTVVVSSPKQEIANNIQDVFMTKTFRVYTSEDMIGVELGGALKNIIAIAAGISDGLGFGANTKAALLARGLVEISRLGITLGAKPETFMGLSGMGDLVTTCISPHGRNRRVGEEIGKGKKIKDILKDMEMVAEGVRTTESVYQLAAKHKVEMPITREVYSVLYEDKDPKQAVSDLMTRGKKQEFS